MRDGDVKPMELRKKTIKFVKQLTEDEVKQCTGALKSIVSLFVSDDKFSSSKPRRVFEFTGMDGKEEKCEFNKVKVIKNKSEYSIFDASSALFPVKISYSDGSCEYGFKYYNEVWYETKPRLTSLYRKVGVINPRTGKNEYDCDNSSLIPSWIEHYLKFYTGCHKNASLRCLSKEDWAEINSVIHSSHISHDAVYARPPINSKFKYDKVPYLLEVGENGHWYASMTNYNNEGVLSTMVCRRSKKDNSLAMFDTRGMNHRITEYSYLKSVYESQSAHKNQYKLIPISNIFSITKENGDELWNNMDSTLHGKM